MRQFSKWRTNYAYWPLLANGPQGDSPQQVTRKKMRARLAKFAESDRKQQAIRDRLGVGCYIKYSWGAYFVAYSAWWTATPILQPTGRGGPDVRS